MKDAGFALFAPVMKVLCGFSPLPLAVWEKNTLESQDRMV